MTLRDDAAALIQPRQVSAIDQVIADHPERADEIMDLILGEPRLSSRIVGKVLGQEFGIEIGQSGVQRWRSKR